MNPEIGHLYHDTHFTGLVSGGALEAREQLKAREVNAREERLLRQQDQNLQQAKDLCQKRSRWEQDSLRRDLGAILQRTPTFLRTLNEEKQRLRGRRAAAYSQGKGKDKLTSRRKNGKIFDTKHSDVFLRRRPGVVAAQSSILPKINAFSDPLFQNSSSLARRNRLPPVVNNISDGEKRTGGTTGFITEHPLRASVVNAALHPSNGDGQMFSKPPDAESPGQEPFRTRDIWAGQGKLTPEVRSVPRAHKYDRPGESSRKVTATQCSRAGVKPPSAADLGDYNDATALVNVRGEQMRRRSHHAIMAIVRVQARHEQRMREADLALARAAHRYRFSEPSPRSMKELSKLLSGGLNV